MWSGGKGDMNSWALDIQKCQTMKHADVDWGELAKKWMEIRESSNEVAQEIPSVFLQPPPPPPLPESSYSVEQPLPPQAVSEEQNTPHNDEATQSTVENSGSVDMEIEEDKDTYSQSYQSNGNAWKNWSHMTGAYDTSQVHQNWTYNYGAMGHNQLGDDGHAPNVAHGHSSSNDNGNQYWNSQNMTTSSGIMMQKVVDYGHKDRRAQSRESYPEQRDPEITANQRKHLPVWIREGLEKMERDKFKISEKERLKLTLEEERRKKKEEDEKARRLFQEFDDGKPRPPVKSKFDSDSADSDVGEEDIRVQPKNSPEKEPMATANDIDGHGLDRHLTEEEKIAEMTTLMRTLIIEVLMDVTDQVIGTVCTEVVGKARIKVQQSKKSPGLGLLSGGLGGLGIYANSGGESEPEEDATEEQPTVDSDEELRQTIRRKRRDFENVEREILRKMESTQNDTATTNNGSDADEPDSGRSSPESSSADKHSDEHTDEFPTLRDSHSGDANLPEATSRVAQSSIESDSNVENSESRSSSSTVRKKKKKKKKKSKSRRDSSDNDSDLRKRKKKKKKSNGRSRSMSRSPRRRRKSRSRSRTARRSRSRSTRRRSRSRSTRRRSRSRSATRRRRSRSRSANRRLRSSSRSAHNTRRSRSRSTLRHISKSRSPIRRRSRSITYNRRSKRSRSRSTLGHYRRSRRSRSGHRRRRSRSRNRYDDRHRRSMSNTQSGGARNRRSRSVEIKERSKRRSRS